MSANNVASTAMTNKDEDSSEHDKDKALCAEINGCYQVPVHDDDDGDGDGAPTLPTAKTRDDHEDSFQTQQPDEHHSRPTEEFDDEGNTIRVENLVFIEGILGQGAFGTVRLARRKFHTNGHCHHGGNGSSSVSVTSVATTPATPFQGHRPRRGFLDKSVSEPRKKSSFFSEKSDYEMQQEANRSSPQTATHLPDDEKKDSNHVSRDTVNASTDTTPAASSRSKSCVTFSTEKSTRSLSPQSRKKPEAQASSPTPSHGQHRFLKHRTASTPIGRRHRGKRFHHHHHHGGKSPSVVGNLGLFTRSRSSMNHYDEFGYDDDEQLVAVKIFSKSILKRKRTMERDKSTKRVKIKTAWQQVEREIALMKKLSHPNLVQMYEVIDSPESDMLYMVLEYMPGGEILTYQNDGTFRRKNPRPAASDDRYKPMEGIVDGHFDEDHAALYFVDILHGLGYLHLHHVCHRDLKPESE
jgi:serine/threonine protein kinase